MFDGRSRADRNDAKCASVPQDSAWLSDLDEPDVDLSRARSRGRSFPRQVLKLEVG